MISYRTILSQIFYLYLWFFSTNLLFSQNNTWNGSTDSNWHKSCNWSLDLIPTCSHDVIIPDVTPYPDITGLAHCNTIEIQGSAILDINSTGGAQLDIGLNGSCTGSPTNNGGCGCGSLTKIMDANSTMGYPPCGASGPCGSFCYIEFCFCTLPMLCIYDCSNSPCASGCFTHIIYRWD